MISTCSRNNSLSRIVWFPNASMGCRTKGRKIAYTVIEVLSLIYLQRTVILEYISSIHQHCTRIVPAREFYVVLSLHFTIYNNICVSCSFQFRFPFVSSRTGSRCASYRRYRCTKEARRIFANVKLASRLLPSARICMM